MKNKAYILQPDTKAYFPNWDKMTKEEQQKWESDFEAMKKGERKRVKNGDNANRTGHENIPIHIYSKFHVSCQTGRNI